MRTTGRILGIISLSIFLFVYFTEWEFNGSGFPVILINVFLISLFYEIFSWIKKPEKKLVYGIIFIVLEGFALYGTIQVAPVLNYHFLSFRTTVYSNKTILIEKSDGFLGKHRTDTRDYFLSKYGLGKLLIKEIESTQINEKESDCEVYFSKNQIMFDVCTNKFYP